MSGKKTPLMPKATAMWLLNNTSISFEQISAFCGLHPLEVKAMADGDGAMGIRGLDQLLSGQLTKEEINLAAEDPKHQLRLSDLAIDVSTKIKTKKHVIRKYTPISRRQDRPNAILWLVRTYPAMSNLSIVRLVRTTKNTVQQVRERTHWNMANLTPKDPVGLGLCTQIELDLEISKLSGDEREAVMLTEEAPVKEMLIEMESPHCSSAIPNSNGTESQEVENVLARLKNLSGD